VSGLGETQPLDRAHPADEVNRRVSVRLKIQQGSRVGESVTNQVDAAPHSS